MFTNIFISLCFYTYFKDAGTDVTIGGIAQGEIVYAIIKHDSTSKGKGR